MYSNALVAGAADAHPCNRHVQNSISCRARWVAESQLTQRQSLFYFGFTTSPFIETTYLAQRLKLDFGPSITFMDKTILFIASSSVAQGIKLLPSSLNFRCKTTSAHMSPFNSLVIPISFARLRACLFHDGYLSSPQVCARKGSTASITTLISSSSISRRLSSSHGAKNGLPNDAVLCGLYNSHWHGCQWHLRPNRLLRIKIGASVNSTYARR